MDCQQQMIDNLSKSAGVSQLNLKRESKGASSSLSLSGEEMITIPLASYNALLTEHKALLKERGRLRDYIGKDKAASLSIEQEEKTKPTVNPNVNNAQLIYKFITK